MQVVIGPYFNDTAALYADKWIPILPNTDEAMMVAIAYTWFKEGLIDEAFAKTHTVGFDEFKNYVLGNEDGVPKTPEWAEKICKVNADTIRWLAREWASKPTYIIHSAGGANRRTNGVQWVRLIIVLQTISGNIGRPGGGLSGGLSEGFEISTRPANMKAFGSVPGMKTPIVNKILHVYFRDAVINPPVKWTSIGTDGNIYTYTYPNPNTPEIKMIAFSGGSGFTMNQNPGVRRHIEALQSPKIEFIYCQTPWWETAAKYSDIVLPVRYLTEREDIAQWENFAVYMHKIAEAVPEAKTDLDIYIALAQRLGFEKEFTEGKTPEQWLRELYAAGNVPMSFEEFKKVGFYEYEFPAQTPVVRFKEWRDDPEKNKLPTPSGKVEIYVKRIADAFGADSPYTLPRYIPPAEGLDNPLAKEYPLIALSPHPKVGRHSQWQNAQWVRSNEQMYIDGYRVMYINPVDAEARGLKDHDLVKVYNQRGAIICAARVTERIMPGVVSIWEGGWYQPQEPGNRDSIDLGGNMNVLIDPRPGELTHGMIANTLVQVEKWRG
jgi:molybdopterin guanine dinucleotide-containing S/N-oxide reductase-like protein